jgi:tRNA modification GTPase
MESAYSVGQPIVALATPYGRAALAIIRISGDRSVALIKPFFSHEAKLTTSGQMVFGRLYDEHQILLDEVMIAPFFNGAGYTGEEAAEIYLHGNPIIAQNIIAFLCRHGFKAASPGAFTYRAFMLGKMDLAQAESVHEVITAQTAQASHAALQRLSGTLSRQLNDYYQQLIAHLAALEARLNYPEEESDFYEVPNFMQLLKELKALLDSFKVSRILMEGALVVVAGAPNVGKSSIFNRFSGQDRAIVSPQAGTTRDYIETTINLQGYPVRLVDTAGLRKSEDSIEQLGIAKSEQLMREADLILYVVDASTHNFTEPMTWLYPEKTLAVANKIDLCPVKSIELFVACSTVCEEGLNALIEAVCLALDPEAVALRTQSSLLGSVRQYDHCFKAHQAVLFAHKHSAHLALDELAYHLRLAAQELAILLGNEVEQDAMNAMFSTFCLGK